MKKTFSLLSAFIILFLLIPIPASIEARPLFSLTLSQISPSACPGDVCAAGQRINVRAAFTVAPLYTSGPNTQVCLYTSMESGNKWADGSVFSITNTSIFTAGEQAGICSGSIPASTELLGSAFARFDTASSQNFDFGFRINKTSAADGSLQVSLYQVDAAGTVWGLSESPETNSFSTAHAANPAYVSPSAGACTGNPCYLNSSDDLAEGIGTGLKDAVDASPSDGTIIILGTYFIKANTVIISSPQTLRGIDDATLTYSGTSCGNAMLSILNGATIHDLNINDGICTSPSRDIISISSATDVTLESNDLVNGKDAISVIDNAGNVSVRFNQITGNSGYGILRASGNGGGTVKSCCQQYIQQPHRRPG